MKHLFIAIVTWATLQTAIAQGFRPPPFVGGVPGMSQMQAIQLSRQQARALLYREALEELRKNPRAADYVQCAPGASSDDVCVPNVAADVLPADSKPVIRKHVALLFGNNAYVDPVPRLDTPVADVESIAQILRVRYGYEVTVVRNATKAATARALNQLAANVSSDDSVLVFYAGHGYLLEDNKMGYWLPVDASEKTAANWISNSDISQFLTAIPARQLILISDSCYSGTLTRGFPVSARAKLDPDEVLRRRSVLVLTSGGDEPVSDDGKDGHSIFAFHLLNVLNAAQGLTPGANVFTEVHQRVSREYPQTPQYGAAIAAGHTAGGEYLFSTAK